VRQKNSASRGRLTADRSLLFALLSGFSTPLFAQQAEPPETDVAPAGVEPRIVFVAGTGIATNPFNEPNPGSAAVVATIEARPTISSKSETGTLELQGLIQLRQYSRRYGLEDNYSANVRAVTRRSDRLTVRGNFGFAYNEAGLTGARAGDFPLGATPSAGSPGLIPDISAPLDDITLIGQRSRITALNASVGVDYRLDDRTFLSADVAGRSMKFDLVRFGDYYFFTEELGVSHSLNDRTSVGVIGQLAQIDYENGRVGDAKSYNGLLSVDHQFDAAWTASVAVGLSVTTAKQLPSQPDIQFESLTFRGRICRSVEASSLCLNTQRSPQPSANGSVRTAQSYSLSYSQRVSPRDRLSFSGNYADMGASRAGGTTLAAVKYYGAEARYEKDLRANITAFGNVTYGKIDQDTALRKANFGAMLGLRFKFGASK
jgi:hypothetical protein